ncbi:hypothetical protein HMPREF0860_0944 [Treponema socranskii subsp. socranskii VPI DR56BR1116 = ATCC 35536]|uniref:Lipoprotein n=1 Tax=Treponema socranskii subsp. socranskii VPI DR56BR1116 = ATCC 35536 TaxID=1125725 RepID=A0ABN0P4G2_TRESO|nr:hypothetical protein HMPREF0860_0944 [Treponema socranskii subsp. socranskii VPI DR56BR1116 = ATCC 35536]
MHLSVAAASFVQPSKQLCIVVTFAGISGACVRLVRLLNAR